MRAFTNTLQTKSEALAALQTHMDADHLIQGQYWNDGKGCAVACLYKDYVDDADNGDLLHRAAESVHGIPKPIAQLVDAVFEGLSNQDAQLWPKKFIESIPDGADLSKVWNHFALWLLLDQHDGVIRFAKGNCLDAIENVGDLHRQVIAGHTPSDAARAAAWDAAGDAAGDAAWAAAWDAAWAAAWDAAWDAAGDAAWDAAGAAAGAAAWDAAGDAAGAAAWDAAWDAHYIRMQNKLLTLVKSAPTEL